MLFNNIGEIRLGYILRGERNLLYDFVIKLW